MRVAFVVQLLREVNGGAESLCLQIAQRVGRHWPTEVLTTCALDYMTWENSYPEGVEQAGSTLIRRFPVDTPRDVPTFNALSETLHPRRESASLAEQEAWMRAQGPVSSSLLDYLRAQASSYDSFVFFGYLYATSYFGLPIVRDKAFLAPLAHDEWTIYFNMWDRFFALPKAFIFSTGAERQLVRQRFPRLSHLAGFSGHWRLHRTPPQNLDPRKAFACATGPLGPSLLYVGRD